MNHWWCPDCYVGWAGSWRCWMCCQPGYAGDITKARTGIDGESSYAMERRWQRWAEEHGVANVQAHP